MMSSPAWGLNDVRIIILSLPAGYKRAALAASSHQQVLQTRKLNGMRAFYLLLALPLLAGLFLLEIQAYPNQVRVSSSDDDLNHNPAGLVVPRSTAVSNHVEERNKRGLIVGLIVVTAWVACAIFCGRGGSQGGGTPPPPAPIHGNWGEWYDIGACSTSCGTGGQRIQRLCDSPPPQHGGTTCQGASLGSRPCFHTPCPIDGGWSTWTEEGICKENSQVLTQLSCGKGVKEFTRACSQPLPKHGGEPCGGASLRFDICDAGICPGCFLPPIPEGVVYHAVASNFTQEEKEVIAPDTEFRHTTVISFACDDGFGLEVAPPPGQSFHSLACTRGNWLGVSPVCNDINECTTDVHGCDPVRTNCSNHVGSFSCYCKDGFEKDDQGECKGVPVHGGWGRWVPSGACSQTCGAGQQRHERQCTSPAPRYGGAPCSGDDFKYEPCNTHCCPVHGIWSDWIDSPCSVTCGSGVRQRRRSCHGPFCGGQDCNGNKEVEEVCHQAPCRKCILPPASPGVLYHALPGVVEFGNGEVLEYSCGRGFNFTFNPSTQSFRTVECDAGVWQGDAPQCDDLNECEDGTHTCIEDNSQCLNTEGSFECHCLPGFQLSADGKKCENVDECAVDGGGCKQLCRDDVGSYQCYCRDGYQLDSDGFSCSHPSSDCSELPTPANGAQSCQMEDYGLICQLTCDLGFEFSGSYDPSPQTCIGGVWRYQQDMVEIPDCEDLWDTFITFGTVVENQGDCVPGSNYDADADDLFATATGEGKVATTATCSPTTSGKRAASGSLSIRMIYTIALPRGCSDRTCRNAALKKLYARATKVKQLIGTGGAAVTVTDVDAQETTSVVLSGTLRGERPQLTCARGSVPVGGQCVQCGKGYFYNDTGSRATCQPCPFSSYQDQSGSFACQPCPGGTFTSTMGSKSLTSCRAPCAAGTSSPSGLVPCAQCPLGTFQNGTKAAFCFQCPYQMQTATPGSTSLEDCGCPGGSYWQGCSRSCGCVNGGSCTIDGACDCPRGWTGTDCSKPNPYESCQDNYFVRFVSNYAHQENRTIVVLASPSRPADVDVFIAAEDTGSLRTNSSLHLQRQSVLAVPLDPRAPLVYEFSLYPFDRSTVIGYNGEYASADAFSALPVQRLHAGQAQEYRAVSVGQSRLAASGALNSTVLVIGTENHTTVTVRPSRDAVVSHSGLPLFETINLPRGEDYQLEVGKYQTVTISSRDDLTGTRVTAYDRPVVVYSGHQCGNVPFDKFGCDHMIKQLPPLSVWGHSYVVTPFLERTVDSFLKVVAGENGTVIKITCSNAEESVSLDVTVGPFGDGEFYERFIPANDSCHVRSDKKILAIHFITGQQSDTVGDPSMLVLPSTEDLVDEVTFYSFDLDPINKYLHFLSIVVPEEHSSPDKLILDEDPLSSYEYVSFSLQSDSKSFKVFRLRVAGGYHSLKHQDGGDDGTARFTASVYGLASYASYAYSPGMNQVTSCNRAAKSYYA